MTTSSNVASTALLAEAAFVIGAMQSASPRNNTVSIAAATEAELFDRNELPGGPFVLTAASSDVDRLVAQVFARCDARTHTHLAPENGTALALAKGPDRRDPGSPWSCRAPGIPRGPGSLTARPGNSTSCGRQRGAVDGRDRVDTTDGAGDEGLVEALHVEVREVDVGLLAETCLEDELPRDPCETARVERRGQEFAVDDDEDVRTRAFTERPGGVREDGLVRTDFGRLGERQGVLGVRGGLQARECAEFVSFECDGCDVRDVVDFADVTDRYDE